MSAVGVAGILLSLMAFSWFTVHKNNRTLALFLIIVMLHVITSYVYYVFVQSNDADTKLYYYDIYGFYSNGFGLGTMFVVYVTQSMRGIFGGSYLDYFLFYQFMGVWGLALLMRTMQETASVLETPLPPLLIGLLFLPGLYFWTSAIGKDPALFLACALAVWSCFRISNRWFWFGVAVAAMALFRAHIALLTVVSLALALVAGRGVPKIARGLLAVAALVSGYFLLSTLQSELRVELSSVGAIANYVELQTSAATRGEDNTLVGAAFPIKLISVLYRPLFFDATSAFSIIASFQNVVLILISIMLVRNFRLWVELFRSSLAIRFATIHFFAIYTLLAFAYYNVGLGLRQREMATPALLAVFATVFMVSRLRRQAATLTQGPPVGSVAA
jgi:hypothetical protein